MSYEKERPFGVELMRTKHCLKYAFDMCKSSKKLYLLDDKGKKYKLHFDCKKCEMCVIDIV
jgi:putative protease